MKNYNEFYPTITTRLCVGQSRVSTELQIGQNRNKYIILMYKTHK